MSKEMGNSPSGKFSATEMEIGQNSGWVVSPFVLHDWPNGGTSTSPEATAGFHITMSVMVNPKTLCRMFRGAFSLANQNKVVSGFHFVSVIAVRCDIRLSSSPNCGHCGWSHTFKRAETDFTSGQGRSRRRVAWQCECGFGALLNGLEIPEIFRFFHGWNSFKSYFLTQLIKLIQIGDCSLASFGQILSGLICILCQSYLPWTELNSMLIWSHIHIFHIHMISYSHFSYSYVLIFIYIHIFHIFWFGRLNGLGTPRLPKALSLFAGAMSGQLIIPDPSWSGSGQWSGPRASDNLRNQLFWYCPFCENLGAHFLSELINSHVAFTAFTFSLLKKSTVIGEIVKVSSSLREKAKSVMPIASIQFSRDTHQELGGLSSHLRSSEQCDLNPCWLMISWGIIDYPIYWGLR